MDPKLQATYDKVMGTPTAPAAPGAPVNPVIGSAPAAAPIAPTTGPVIPTDMAQSAIPTSPATAAYTPDNLSFQAAIQAPAAGVPNANTAKPVAHGTSPALKILYIFASIIFFVIYTFVWMKIFDIPLPF